MPVDTSSFTPAQLQAYNYAASLAPQPTTSYVNPNAAMQIPAAKPVAALSSVAGQNIVNTNTNNLQKLETSYAGPSIVDYLNSAGQDSSFGSRTQLAGQQGIQNYTGTADQNTQLLQALRTPQGNPAATSMVTDINKAVQGGGLTGDELNGLRNIQSTQDDVIAAAASARAALESKDYTSMNAYTNRAQELEKTLTGQLSEYYKATAPLRQRQMELLSPGAKEQELSRALIDIRSQADAFNLQTEEDKFREYEGQTLGFAGGRASEIDFKASFKRQEMQNREKNLLLSLGLEQDARKMTGDAIEGQLSYLAEDFELQSKVQDRLVEIEDQLYERADKLQGEAKTTLIEILNSLSGVDPEKLPASSRQQLETMAARAGIPFELVSQALATQFARQTFEDALKTDAQKNFQFVAGTDNQPGGVFDPSTGTFTRTGGGGVTGGGSGITGTSGSTDPFVNLLLSTKGGKPITDTFAQSLNKGLNVLSQIGGLQANIKDTNTGPLLGAFRGANPWDTNAQTIKAQLNAIVPNLARGVYGEVGVLTDNDIAQYAKTLPTLNSTEDLRNAVLGITVDLISKSIKRTLEINAANQKDVSGFVDIYTEMNATRDSIFAQIPGYNGAGTQSLSQQGITAEDEDVFDSVVTNTTPGGGGFFADIWRGLTGQ